MVLNLRWARPHCVSKYVRIRFLFTAFSPAQQARVVAFLRRSWKKPAFAATFLFALATVPALHATVYTFTVTTLSDTSTGIAGDCNSGSTTDISCSLRDAITAAGSSSPAVINFSSSLSAGTLSLVNGVMSLPSNVTINGSTSGSGTSLTNFITIDGGTSMQIFSIANYVSGVVLNNLNLTRGYNYNCGGAMYIGGSVNINSSNFTNNSSVYGPGALCIQNAVGSFTGSVTITNSTFSGNSDSENIGGAIYAAFRSGPLTITGSTITNNYAYAGGGGIEIDPFIPAIISSTTITGNSSSTKDGGLGAETPNSTYINNFNLTATNTIIEGNSAPSNPDMDSAVSLQPGSSGNLISQAPTATTSPGLSALGGYGGPTKTMMALPGSAASCAGLAANIPNGVTTDQRGNPRTATYASGPCVDAGSTQAAWSLAFVQQPTDSVINTLFSPSPSVSLLDNGNAIPVAGGSIAMTDSGNALSGTLSRSTASTGVATFSALSVTSTEASDTLTASTTVTTNTLTATSGSFSVRPSFNHFTVTGTPTSVTAGTSFNVVVTAYNTLNNSQVATTYTGPIKFTSTDTAAVFPTTLTLTAGTGTFSITLKTAGAQSISVADASGALSVNSSNITVNAAALNSLLAVSGGGQSAVEGVAFTNPLVVEGLDAYSNSVAGAAVTFTTPSTGAGAAFTGSPATTAASTGLAQVTATANTNLGTYNVTASSGSVSTTFSLTNIAPPPVYTVTVSSDTTTGTASHCTSQSLFGATPDASCSLRDALAAAYPPLSTGCSTASSGPLAYTGGSFSGTFNAGEVITFPFPSAAGTIYMTLPNSTTVTLGPSSPVTYTFPTTGTYSFYNNGYVGTTLCHAPANTAPLSTGCSTASSGPLAYTGGSFSGTFNAGEVITFPFPSAAGTIYMTLPNSTTVTLGPLSPVTYTFPTTGTYSFYNNGYVGTTSCSGAVINPITINFSASKFPAATTITLAHGTLNVPSYTTVQGLTSGSGATATNLITVNGGGATNNSSVFSVASGVTGAVLSKLIITNGNAPVYGGGIYNEGALTVNSSTISGNTSGNAGAGLYNFASMTVSNSTISNNTSSGAAGGVFNSANLTILASTISGNSAPSDFGGGIYNGCLFSTMACSLTLSNSTVANNSSSYVGGIYVNAGISNTTAVTITNSTITGNTTTNRSGGIYVVASNTTLNISNSIVSGNLLGTTESDCGLGQVSVSGTGCPSNDVNGNITGIASSSLGLATLGSYGGPTMTLAELPGSPALCAGTVANASGLTTDQRGNPRIATYGSNQCVDAGAVQMAYSLSFVQQPTNVQVSSAITPSPTVQLDDNGAAISFSGAPIGIAASAGTLSGTASQSTSSTGLATFSGLSVGAAESSDTLVASISAGTNTISATSSSFNVVAVDHFGFTGLPTATTAAGTVFTGTVTAYLANNSVATAYSGPVKFTSSDGQAVLPGSITLTAGVSGTLSFTLKTVGAQTITVADSSGSPSTSSSSIPVSAAGAASIVTSSGSGQSTVIGSAFTNPLTVQVLDAYGNLIGSNVVNFTVPSTGASASLSASSCTTSTVTASLGTCSVNATANGTASSTAYTVSAKATSVTTPTSFTLTNNAVTPTLTVTASPTTLVYGQPVTITATSTPLSAGGSYPTGTVTFYGGSTGATMLGTASAVNGVATYSSYAPGAGAVLYGAASAGDSNFMAVTESKASSITVGKATISLTPPSTQPVQFLVNAGGSIPIPMVPQYYGSGTLQAVPTGSLTYSIAGCTLGSGCSGSQLLSGGGASIPIPSALPSGPYTVTIGYAGDSNFLAATSIQVSILIGKITATVSYPAQSSIVYGTALTTANLNATVTYNSSNITSSGTLTYTATLGSGTPQTISAGTVLSGGTWTLTATWTPSNTVLYNVVTGTSSITVNPVTDTVLVTSNRLTGNTLTNFSFTATVSSNVAGTPSGTVTFTGSNGSSFGPYTLVNGTISGGGKLTGAAAGPVTITANYSGDVNYVANVGTTLVTIGTASYSLVAVPASLTVTRGQSASTTITMTPTFGYTGTASFSCGNLPAYATCSFAPASLTADGSGTAISTVMTITTAAPQALPGSSTAAGFWIPGILAALLLGFGRGRLPKRMKSLLTLILIAALFGAGGCGSPNVSTPKGVYISSVSVSAVGSPGTGSSNQQQELGISITIE